MMMHLCTIQSGAVRSMIECFKDMLNDCNLIFNETGVSLVTLDTSRTSLVDMKLDAQNFEEYTCDGTVVCGINMSNTWKILKSVSTADILRLSVTSREYMTIEIESEAKKTKSSFQLKLLDINDNRITVPEIQTSSVTTMPSTDLQRLVRDMANIGSDLLIERYDKVLKLHCEGDFANQETCVECADEVAGHTKGVFSIKFLNVFTKCTSMCSNVMIMQEDQKFLILQYDVAMLGTVRFFLAAKALED